MNRYIVSSLIDNRKRENNFSKFNELKTSLNHIKNQGIINDDEYTLLIKYVISLCIEEKLSEDINRIQRK